MKISQSLTCKPRDGGVVRALASQQCGPGLIPRSSVISGLNLLVLYSALTSFLWILKKEYFTLFVLIVNSIVLIVTFAFKRIVARMQYVVK